MTGADVARLRGALGLSTNEFASVVGVSIPTAYRWEAFGAEAIQTDDRSRMMLNALIGEIERRRSAAARAELAASLKSALLVGGGLLALYVLLDAILPSETKARALKRRKG